MLLPLLRNLDQAGGSAAVAVTDQEGFVLTRRKTVATGTEWAHALPSVVVFISPGPMDQIWTDMDAAATELGTRWRQRRRMDGVVAARMLTSVTVIGAAGATLGVQYSLDSGSSWSSTVTTVSLAATGAIAGSWATWPAEARGDVLMRIVGVDGDGATDPQYAYIALECSSRLET